MKPELKAKWITALRGGEYKQAQGDLKCDHGFCCLGVLLDVSKRGDWDGSEYVIEDGGERMVIAGELEGYAKAVGLTASQEARLIQMNDGKKDYDGQPRSFAEIADYIEANL